MKIALSLLTLAFGLLAAFGEATPAAGVFDTRLSTLLAGLLLLALAMLQRGRVGMGFGGAAVALLLAAAVFYARYGAEEVRIRSDDGTLLEGTLVLPRRVVRPPVVVYVHGSGRDTRREFRHYAQLLAKHGFASLIYDKRGAGKSTGSTFGVGYDGYTRDALAVLRYVASRPEIDPTRIVLFGQSEGGWVAPLIARSFPLRAIVVSSTTNLTPAQQVLFQTGEELRRRNADPAIVARAMSLQQQVLDYQRSGRAAPTLNRELRRAATEPWFAHARLPEQVWPVEEYGWWRKVMDYDPMPHWREVRVPVLAISGGFDFNSDVRASQAAICATLASNGNRDFTGHVYPRAEHGMIEWKLPRRVPPPSWPSGMPEDLIEWLESRTRAANARVRGG